MNLQPVLDHITTNRHYRLDPILTKKHVVFCARYDDEPDDKFELPDDLLDALHAEFSQRVPVQPLPWLTKRVSRVDDLDLLEARVIDYARLRKLRLLLD